MLKRTTRSVTLDDVNRATLAHFRCTGILSETRGRVGFFQLPPSCNHNPRLFHSYQATMGQADMRTQKHKANCSMNGDHS